MSPSPRIGEREGVRGCERSGFAICTARNEAKNRRTACAADSPHPDPLPNSGRGKHLPINLAALPTGAAELLVASSVTQCKYARTHFALASAHAVNGYFSS